MSKKTINPAAAKAELVKAKRVLRAEKKRAKKVEGDKLERANTEHKIQTLAAGVKAVQKLRDAGKNWRLCGAAGRMSGGARRQMARLKPTLLGWNVAHAMGVEQVGGK